MITTKMNKKITTLDLLRSHPAVESIEKENDGFSNYYWINLRTGYSTDYGIGQSSGSEKTLRDVANFLRTVRPEKN